MGKCAVGELAHGILPHRGEQNVPQLLESGIDDLADAIGNNEDDGHREPEQDRGFRPGTIQRVDDTLIGKRNQRTRYLRQQQSADCK